MRAIPLGVVPARAWADSAAFVQRKYEQQAGNVPASHPIQQGSLRRAFSFSGHIMAKAKTPAKKPMPPKGKGKC